MWSNLRHDYARIRQIRGARSPFFLIECLLFETGFQAVLLHRLAHWCKRRRFPFFGPFFGRLCQLATGVEIGPSAQIGPGLFIAHGQGVVIGGYARIGARAFLWQQVTVGALGVERAKEMPVLGDDVFLGAGAKVLGPVRVGDRVFVGANALVVVDVPADSRVLSTAGIEIVRHIE